MGSTPPPPHQRPFQASFQGGSMQASSSSGPIGRRRDPSTIYQDNGYQTRRTPNAGGDPHPSPRADGGSGMGGAYRCDFSEQQRDQLPPPTQGSPPTTQEDQAQDLGKDSCPFTCSNELDLILHKADRHLIYPPGGVERLRMLDPMLIAEERERRKRLRGKQKAGVSGGHRRGGTGEADLEGEKEEEQADGDDRILDGPADATISGLNIQLNTPELVAEWIAQRKKRWPTSLNVEKKRIESEERRRRGEIIRGLVGGQIGGSGGKARHIDEKNQGRDRTRAEEEASETKVGPGKEEEREVRTRRQEVGNSGAQDDEMGGSASSDTDGPPSEEEATRPKVPGANLLVATPSQLDPGHDDDDESDSESEAELDSESDSESSDSGSGGESDSGPEVMETTHKAPTPSKDASRSADPRSNAGPEVEDGGRRRQVCKFFLQGRCGYGDQCRKRHQDPNKEDEVVTPLKRSDPSANDQERVIKRVRRVHPRAPPPNPFGQPDLLRQLLKNEIAQHVSTIAQAIRFFVDNEMLLNVEPRPGEAEEQRRRRGMITVIEEKVVEEGRCALGSSRDEPTAPVVEIKSGETAKSGGAAEAEFEIEAHLEQKEVTVDPARVDESTAKVEESDGPRSALPQPELSQPIQPSGLTILKVKEEQGGGEGEDTTSGATRSSLFKPESPLLKPLKDLKWPEEPDPLIYLDPLRRDDPKPLRPDQLQAIATDASIRKLLTPSDPLHPHGKVQPGLKRALDTLDSLPTDRHRNAAIEMILGVSDQSPIWAHESYSRTQHLHQRGGLTSSSSQGRRVISETELFRLGLRVGVEEVVTLQNLAELISRIVQGPEFESSSSQLFVGGGVQAASQIDSTVALDGFQAYLRDKEREWAREADRRERCRRLGLRID
ncbi:hypothetical protein IE53DRAFT_380289 [Violaceomyces palustris]|uniref:Uncharacterized protein n=1 Tax=Violaceomyces palustris TaxID=1673888 RepID=A0ACD0NV94_9BASI|nr:hypothetical protein IE53DRAFT_380289 [Violaceomyces palustris]